MREHSYNPTPTLQFLRGKDKWLIHTFLQAWSQARRDQKQAGPSQASRLPGRGEPDRAHDPT